MSLFESVRKNLKEALKEPGYWLPAPPPAPPIPMWVSNLIWDLIVKGGGK